MKNKNTKTNWTIIAAAGVLICLTGCTETIHEAAAGISDPTERGCMYIATAIVISAVIRAFAND